MSTFRFGLRRVLELREGQLRVEEAKLEQLHAVRRRIQSDIDELQNSLVTARSSLEGNTRVYGSDLIMLERFSHRVVRERQERMKQLDASNRAVEQQKNAVVAARSRVRLLEKLREKKKAEWMAGEDRKEQEEAADFAAAQWLRLHSGW